MTDVNADIDIADELAAIIGKIQGSDEPVFVHSYVLLVDYSSVSEPIPQLLTWWSESPCWKQLGMVTGMVTGFKQMSLDRYDECMEDEDDA